MDNIKGVVGYVRVSTINQVQNGEGLAIQRKMIEDHCRSKGLKLDRIYADEGISGMVKDRPGLLQMLGDCEAGLVGQIIIYRQDRLSRELGQSIVLQAQLQKFGVELVSLLEPELNVNDPMGKALSRMILVFGECERDLIAWRLKSGRRNRAQNGKVASGAHSFGYRPEGDVLVPDEKEAAWVIKIFKWRRKGFSFSKIANLLDKAGVRTKRNKPFSIPSLAYVCGNSFYHGAMDYADIHVKGAHRSLISKKLFMAVQRVKGTAKISA